MAKRGRPPIKPAQPPESRPNEEAIGAARAEATALGRQLAVIEERFGLAPYDRQRVIEECRFFMSQSAEAMLELGKRLLQMKEVEPHGEFMDCLRAVGIEQSIANHIMRAALKFSSNSPTFANLGRSKLYELAFLDDQEIKELAEGGTVAGLQLDEIDRMSVRELRAALRDARAEKEAADQLIEKKNKKIDELDMKLSAKRKHDLDPQAQARLAMRESCAIETIKITTAIAALDALLTQAREQDMHMHWETYSGIARGVALAQRALSRLIGVHALHDPDEVPSEIFAPAQPETRQ